MVLYDARDNQAVEGLWSLTACELLDAYRARAISPVEVVGWHSARIGPRSGRREGVGS